MGQVATVLALLVAGAAGAGSPPLAVQVLGSGGPRPSAQASSGTLVLVDGLARVLVDAGPGTLLRAGEHQVDLSELDTVLLTHLHTDHSVELPSFATVRSLDGRGPTTLRVIGPDGNKEFPSTRAFVWRCSVHGARSSAVRRSSTPAGAAGSRRTCSSRARGT